MQIKEFTKVRNISVIVTILSAIIIFVCYTIDIRSDDVSALRKYITYSRTMVEDAVLVAQLESCSLLMKEDMLYKSDPDHVPRIRFETVEDMEAFIDGWDSTNTYSISPYINAYIKQSLWEYADWCIDESSDDYWHMKYVASQKTGAYSYARQIKYRWQKLLHENIPFISISAMFMFVFVNIVCILYGFSGSRRTSSKNIKIPKQNNDSDGEQ